jgi:hypothetical protein
VRRIEAVTVRVRWSMSRPVKPGSTRRRSCSAATVVDVGDKLRALLDRQKKLERELDA